MRAVSPTGIGYDTDRLEALAENGSVLDMSNDFDVFVNGNNPNVHIDTSLEQNAGAELFEQQHMPAGAFDSDDEAIPVLVYTGEDGTLLGWYDMENYCGYVPPKEGSQQNGTGS